MTTSPVSRRLLYVLVATVCTALAVTLGIVLLRPDTAPHQARFTGYSIVKAGGIAGVRHQVEVSADGTVLYADDQPVAGRLSQRGMNRLSTLLSDPELAKEGNRSTGSPCADAFRYTLTVGSTKVSREDCGGDDTPLLSEIIDLTAKDDLQPLPANAPTFRGLTATYRQDWQKVRAKVRVDADGSTEVTKNGGQARRDRLSTGTLDALRLLYAKPLVAPSSSGGVSCVPEQVPVYTITPEGQRKVTVSTCGRQDDYRWTARLTIIRALIGD